MSVSPNRAIAGNRRRLAGASLALVPLAAFVLFGLLLFPRAAPPDEVPLPRIDRALLDAIRHEEDALAKHAEASGLGPDARVLGTELRAYHALQFRKAPRAELEDAKVKVEKARAFVVAREGLTALRALFSVQQLRFLAELEHWERASRSGVADDPARARERSELGGAFLQRLREGQWATDHDLTANDDERRVLFKMMWGTDVGLDGEAPFALSKDERRVLYGLFLRAPHPAELVQASLRAAIARAKTPQDCAVAEAEMKRATARWRVAKILALSEFDADYPKHYALGIAQLEAADPAAAAQAFRSSLDQSSDGPYALRCRNLLKYALSRLEQ